MLKIDSKLIYGVPEIDDEHKELIQRADNLMQAYQNGDPKPEVLKLLVFLKDYVVNHFAHEEELQQSYHYPNYDVHKQEHEDFKNDVEMLYAYISHHGLGLEARLKLNYIANEWILHHIGGSDRLVCEHILKERNPIKS